MNFKEDFEYYLTKKFEEHEYIAPYLIEEIVRHIEVNYIIPLKSELYTLSQKYQAQLILKDIDE